MNASELKLKVAAEEIKEILRKYDIAGAVVLHTPGHGEYFLHLNPTYSCVYVLDDNEIRINSKLENYGNRQQQLKVQAESANMLKLLTDLTVVNFGILNGLSEKIDDATNAIHTR